jgi:hypothetical protein
MPRIDLSHCLLECLLGLLARNACSDCLLGMLARDVCQSACIANSGCTELGGPPRVVGEFRVLPFPFGHFCIED